MCLSNGTTEGDVLARVTVRLISHDETGQFNYYLEREHYLESSRLVGQWLRYVAEVDGQWVALLTFSAPALRLKARELWIGWSARQRARRLGLVVNNSRFLALPARQRYPNLASRVLGLTLRRLSADSALWGPRPMKRMAATIPRVIRLSSGISIGSTRSKSPILSAIGSPSRRSVPWRDWPLTARCCAAVPASLRNLTSGLYELQKEQKRTTVDTLNSWCQQQTFTTLWPLLKH